MRDGDEPRLLGARGRWAVGGGWSEMLCLLTMQEKALCCCCCCCDDARKKCCSLAFGCAGVVPLSPVG